MTLFRYHNIFSLCIALAFLIVLQIFSSPAPVFRFLAPAFLVLVGIVWCYNYAYLRFLNNLNHWTLIRPVLLWSSAFGLLMLLPNSFLRGCFLLTSVVLIAFFEYFLGNFAENVLLNETLIVVFGCFVSAAAYSFYYPKFQILYTVLVFAGSFLATRALYEFVPQQPGQKLISSLVLALFMAEIFWTLTFLQFHYSALAIVLFNIYYFCLMLNYYHIYSTLNIKKIQFHFGLMAACILFVMLLTPWNTLR